MIEDVNKLMMLISDAHNNTRLWSNCRHTPQKQLSKEPFNISDLLDKNPSKVDRKDPCPCGSGKSTKNVVANELFLSNKPSYTSINMFVRLLDI